MLLTEYNETRTMEMFRNEGREEGETRLGTLMTKLRELGRVDDAFRAASDPNYREKMYAEFGMV